MKKLRRITLFMLVLSLFLVGCQNNDDVEDIPADDDKVIEDTSSKDLEKVTLVLDWTPNTNHTGMFVAQDLGYFEEEGLEVEIVQPPAEGAPELVAAGKAEFGVAFQDTIAPAYAKENPLPVTAVAGILQHNTSGIVSLKEDGISTPKDLEGKKYATWENPVEQAIIKRIVEDDGGDFSKVELIPSTVTDVISALQTDVDAIWIFYGWDGVAFELKDMETDFIDFKEVQPIFDYYTPILVANNDLLEENPEIAKSFLKALKRGYEYAIENPEDAAEILLGHAPELDEELVIESQKWLADEYISDADYWGEIDSNRWNKFYEWLYEEELIEMEIPEDFGFTNEFLSK